MPIKSLKMDRNSALRAQKKAILKQRQAQDQVWGRLRKHVEAAVVHEVDTLGTEKFDTETRRVQGLVSDLMHDQDIPLGICVASLANYLSRMTHAMEQIRLGAVVPCPSCNNKEHRPASASCELCKGANLVERDKALAWSEKKRLDAAIGEAAQILKAANAFQVSEVERIQRQNAINTDKEVKKEGGEAE